MSNLYSMFYSPKLYFRDWWINIPLASVALIQLFIWWYLLANIHPSAEQIFLHYNIIFGVDLVGQWWKILYLPIIGGVVILVNFILSYFLYSFDKFIARFLSCWALLFHLFLLAGVILLARLNL